MMGPGAAKDDSQQISSKLHPLQLLNSSAANHTKYRMGSTHQDSRDRATASCIMDHALQNADDKTIVSWVP